MRTKRTVLVMPWLRGAYSSGRADTGLLLLRFGLTAALIDTVHDDTALVSAGTFGTLLCATAIAASALLCLGLFTSMASVVVGMIMIAWTVVLTPTIPLASSHVAFTLLIGMGLALVGPGVYSLDARLFGPYELHIPPRTSPSNE